MIKLLGILSLTGAAKVLFTLILLKQPQANQLLTLFFGNSRIWKV